LIQRLGKVGYQVVGILQAHVQSDQIFGRRFSAGTMRIDGEHQAFVATPAIADPEQLETINECGSPLPPGIPSLEGE